MVWTLRLSAATGSPRLGVLTTAGISPLGVESLPAYLASRGLDLPPDAEIEELAGGVSSTVLAVAAPGRDLVVKRALATLKVAEVWEVSPERTVIEGRALRLAGEIAPDWTPPVVDLDEDTFTLTMGRAPTDWVAWKQPLLVGEARPDVASRLGRHLAGWHAAAEPERLAELGFNDAELFRRLRVDPFYTFAAQRNPEVAAEIDATAERMLATRTALVHGDFSPKNVLVGSGLWVLDFEVAHVGDPSFDLAFMLCHLALKAIHRPQASADIGLAADAFLSGYLSAADGPLDGEHLQRQLGCLLLARVDGKSPVEYLDDTGRGQTRALAHAVLREPDPDRGAFWHRLDHTIRE